MSNSAGRKSNIPKGLLPNKLTAILGGIIVVIVIALIAMILMIPDQETEIIPTDPTELVTTPPTTEAPRPTAPAVIEPTVEIVGGDYIPPEMLSDMAELYSQNVDCAGWLKIDDTVINYPVMYTPEKPYKYLYRNFQGKYKYRGELFIEANCKLEPESQVILIHGHNMNDGTMFQSLLNYKSQKYWENHPTIQFKTLYEERTYEIFAAFRDEIYDENLDVFRYYEFIDPATEDEFNSGISYFIENTSYDMGVDVEYGDRLLMLSTCDRTIANGRFIVVAKLVTEDNVDEMNPETE